MIRYIKKLIGRFWVDMDDCLREWASFGEWDD